MTESWRTVPGYEGLYEASDRGRIRSIDRIVPHPVQGSHRRRGLVLKQVPNNGYLFVKLSRDGVAPTLGVHTVIALTFLGARTGPHIRHLDGDSTNNVPSNLAYGTVAENTADRKSHGTLANPYRDRTHCKHNHEYTPENTVLRFRPNTVERVCLACRKAAHDRRKAA